MSAQPAIHSPATEAWLAAHGRIAHRATWLGTAGTVGAVVIIVAVVATSGSDGPGGIAIAALVAVSIAGLAGLAILIFGLDAIHQRRRIRRVVSKHPWRPLGPSTTQLVRHGRAYAWVVVARDPLTGEVDRWLAMQLSPLFARRPFRNLTPQFGGPSGPRLIAGDDHRVVFAEVGGEVLRIGHRPTRLDRFSLGAYRRVLDTLEPSDSPTAV